MSIDFLFYFFSVVFIINSSVIVLTQNTLYSAFFLVLSFLLAAILLFIFECEFIAMIFIMIYVGAIAILFLFVVMMLNIKVNKLTEYFFQYFPFGIAISSIILLETFWILYNYFPLNPYTGSFLVNYYENWIDKTDSINEIEALGQIIYSNYVVQFLIAGMILLLAVLGVVVLTFSTKKFVKKQITSKQVTRNYANSFLTFKYNNTL